MLPYEVITGGLIEQRPLRTGSIGVFKDWGTVGFRHYTIWLSVLPLHRVPHHSFCAQKIKCVTVSGHEFNLPLLNLRNENKFFFMQLSVTVLSVDNGKMRLVTG